MLIKRHQNRILLSKIIKQKDVLTMHFYFRYRNFNSSKECRIIFINNNCFECVFSDKSYNVFIFNNIREY